MGGFGSGVERRRRGADLRQAREGGEAPVKLMLDRKEEHLATRIGRPRPRASRPACRPTASSPRSMPSRGARAAPARPPASALHLSDREPPDAQDVFINTGQQRPMRAPGHPRGSFITEIMMDELADKVNVDRSSSGSRTCRPRRRTRCGGVPARGRRSSAGTSGIRPATRRGPLKTGMGSRCARGAAAAAARRRSKSHPSTAASSCIGSQDIGTGTRTLVAMVTAESLGRSRRRSPRDRRHALRRESDVGRQHDGRRHQPGDSVAAIKALDVLKEKVAPALGVDAASLSPRRGPHSRRDNPSRGMSWARRASRSGRSRSADGDWQLAVVGDDERRAVRRGHRRYRDRHHEADPDSRAAGLRPRGQPAHR